MILYLTLYSREQMLTNLSRFISESECSDSCSQCSSHSYSGSEEETSASSEAVRTKPPPLPRVPIPHNPTIMPVPITQAEPPSTNSIRPNLHQYLERDNTIWNTAVRDDTQIKSSGYNDHLKPILSNQNARWHSVDNVLQYYKHGSKNSLMPISEGPPKLSHSIIDVVPHGHDERIKATHFRHLFQKELREDVPNTLYRYQNNSYHQSTSLNDRLRLDSDLPERSTNRSGEKNKVKFSDTVTIAVVPVSWNCL